MVYIIHKRVYFMVSTDGAGLAIVPQLLSCEREHGLQ
jgi:hypothetical protein